MPTWVVPSDTHSPGDTGHTTDHNHIADDLTLINSALPVVSGGLTGATAATRFVGATASGPPASGTFAVGDFVIDQTTGTVWVCVVAGNPGVWNGMVNTLATQSISGIKTWTNPQSFSGGTNTSGTATVSNPTFVSGTARQLSTTQDVILYVTILTSAALTIDIGPTSSTTTGVCPSRSYALGLMTFRIPAGWWVLISGTIADLSIIAVTC